MNKHLKKNVTTLLLTLALLTSASSSVYAADWYLEDGDITVTATDKEQTVTQGDTTEQDDAPIIQNRDPHVATDSTITITTESGASANITIEDVNISSESPAIDVGTADVSIQVKGDNTLSTGEAAIHVSQGSVTLDGTGNLTVTSTADAAIGASEGEAMNGDITIQGDVDVNAYGSTDSAVIGAENVMSGSISILGNASVDTGVVDENGKVLDTETGYIGAGNTSDHTHEEGKFNVASSATVNGIAGSDTESLLTYINAYVTESGEAVNLISCTHQYTTTVTEPTCLYSGYTTYSCELCYDSYADHYVDAVDCDYCIWETCGNDTKQHMQVCKYCGRTNGVMADCDFIYVEFADTVYSICATCGTMGDHTIAYAENVTCHSGTTLLSTEDVIVRSQTVPFEQIYGNLDGYTDSTVLADCLITITMNTTDGSLVDPAQNMSVSMEYVSKYGFGTFQLVQLLDNGTWVEIPYGYDQNTNTLTFDTVEAGVFVIVY